MAGESQPEKRLKLDDANICEQEEIRRLKEVVRGLEELLASRNTLVRGLEVLLASRTQKLERKLLEMEESKNKVEREKVKVAEEKNKVEEEKNKVEEEKNKVEKEKNKVEDEKIKFEEEKNIVEKEKNKVEDEKIKFEAKMRKLVECPVCLALPREGPVPCCANGHLVCSPCLGKLRAENKLDCPTCRGPFGKGKSLLAFAVAEKVQHECSHRGCTETTSLEKIVQHEKECKWRLVICPGSGADCAAKIPFCKVEDHAQECQNCIWPPKRYEENGIILTHPLKNDDVEGLVWTAWGTDLIEFEGKVFFNRVFMKDGYFTVDVAMKGSLEECKEYVIEAAILDSEWGSAIESRFTPRLLKEDNKPGFCLTVPFNLMSEVWELDEKEDKFDITIEIAIFKKEEEEEGEEEKELE